MPWKLYIMDWKMAINVTKIILLQDLVYVVDSKPPKRYGDYFLRQIVKVCIPCFVNLGNTNLIGELLTV